MIKEIRYGLARLLSRRPIAVRNSNIDKRASIGNGAQIVNSNIGKYTYVYESKVIDTDIGSFCSIAADCTIGGGSHPTDWVSSSPVFYRGSNVLNKNFSNNEYSEYRRTNIGNDVWIGSKCLIKGGVTIGDGAIVGLGSVVTHDIPPYEVWAGNPAKCIRKRFDDETIDRLKKLSWWNLSDDNLEKLGDKFNNPHEFLVFLEEMA